MCVCVSVSVSVGLSVSVVARTTLPPCHAWALPSGGATETEAPEASDSPGACCSLCSLSSFHSRTSAEGSTKVQSTREKDIM